MSLLCGKRVLLPPAELPFQVSFKVKSESQKHKLYSSRGTLCCLQVRCNDVNTFWNIDGSVSKLVHIFLVKSENIHKKNHFPYDNNHRYSLSSVAFMNLTIALMCNM